MGLATQNRMLRLILRLSKRMRNGFGRLLQVFSVLLSRLLGCDSICRSGPKGCEPRNTGTTHLRREVHVWGSSLPDNLKGKARGSAADGSILTAAERCQGNAFVMSHEKEGSVFEGKPQETNYRSPWGSVSPTTGVAEGGARSNGSESGMPGLSSTIDDLFPVGVDESERYKRGVRVIKGSPDSFVIPYCTVNFPVPITPLPWARFVHPEGAVYYWDGVRRVVTDADIPDPEVYEAVENHLRLIKGYIEEYNVSYPLKETVHLYLEHYPKIPGFGYYFVDHLKQTLFWLEAKYGYNIVRELQTPSPDLGHVGIELRSQYCYHNEYFPHLFDVPMEVLLELQDLLWHAVGDLLTSSDSTVPYTLEDTKNMQGLISDMVTYRRDHERLEVGARTVAYRIFGLFIHERFLNFYGQKHARLCRDQSVFDETRRTWFIALVSPVFFYAPEVYLRKLQSMSVDSFVNKPSWNKLLGKLTEEWKEYTLYATVLLTSNVSFLAIQSLDALGFKGYRDPAQLASYFSIAVSIGTITLSLLLVRQHHTTLQRDFLVNRSVTAIGLETLAVMYSLPYALLMYGMITFFLAFSIMCYQSGDDVTIGILTFAWTSIVLMLLWCISASFEFTIYETHWLGRKYRAAKDTLKGRIKKWSVANKAVFGVSSV